MNAAVLFLAYAQLAREDGVAGPVLEIGVHQGLSAILVAALRGPGAEMVAIDTFGTSSHVGARGGTAADAGASGGMAADERTFRANMARFYTDTSFLRVVTADSRTIAASTIGGSRSSLGASAIGGGSSLGGSSLGASAIGGGFSFCHVDGGHSAAETEHDLALASAVAAPGGIVAIDDYFNPSFPGVSEGTMRYLIEHQGELVPLAIGANKVLFQRAPAMTDRRAPVTTDLNAPATTDLRAPATTDRRAPATTDLNARFVERFGFIPRTRAVFDGHDVLVFGSAVASYVDVERSTTRALAQREVALGADIEPERAALDARPGGALALGVRVRNRSDIPLEWSDIPFGLSYHVHAPGGGDVRYENPRTWFIPPLAPGEERVMPLSIVAPDAPGEYEVRIDVVWEGVCWFRERGNAPARVALRVR